MPLSTLTSEANERAENRWGAKSALWEREKKVLTAVSLSARISAYHSTKARTSSNIATILTSTATGE